MDTNRLSLEDYKVAIVAALCFETDDVDFTLSQACELVNSEIEIVTFAHSIGLSPQFATLMLLD